MLRSSRRLDGSLIVPKSQYQIGQDDDENQIKKLKMIISELEYENNEYSKINRHLRKNTKSVIQENKVLEEEIKKRRAELANLSDLYSKSVEYLEIEIIKSKKLVKLYKAYKIRAFNLQRINENERYGNEEILKFQQELSDIEKSAKKLMKKFSRSEKTVHYYLILLSLVFRLNRINSLFLCEAKNLLSKSSSNLNHLKEKLNQGDQIKIELSLLNFEKSKLSENKAEVDCLNRELNRCLPIYSQILELVKQKAILDQIQLYDDIDIEMDLGLLPDSSSEVDRNAISTQNSVTFDEELNELRRIVGCLDFSYLNDPKRKANIKKLLKTSILFEYRKSDVKKQSKKNKETSKKPPKISSGHKISEEEISDDHRDSQKVDISEELICSQKVIDSERSIQSEKVKPYKKLKQPISLDDDSLFDDSDIDLTVIGLESLLERLGIRDEYDIYTDPNRKRKPALVDAQTSVDYDSFLNSKSFVSHQKKLGGYDPSVFYTSYKHGEWTPNRPKVRNNFPIRLTVSLKDIGLEGLDSVTPDKAFKLRRKERIQIEDESS